VISIRLNRSFAPELRLPRVRPSSSRSGANRRSDACDDRRRVAPQENEDERAERHQRRARLEDRTHADPLPDAGRRRRYLVAATKGEAGRISRTEAFGDAASSPPSMDSASRIKGQNNHIGVPSLILSGAPLSTYCDY
jgi:hypothetical protein